MACHNTAADKERTASSSTAHARGAPSPSLPSLHGDAVTKARVRATVGSGSLSTWQGAGNITNTSRQDKCRSQWLGCTGREPGGDRKSVCRRWMARGRPAHGALRYSLKRFLLFSPDSPCPALCELETGPVQLLHCSAPLQPSPR